MLLSNQKLSFYVLVLAFIAISLFVSSYFAPRTVFQATELVPSNRNLSSEMRKEAKKKEPLDILFLARSSMQNSIHPRLIEEKMEQPDRKYRIYMAGLREGDLFGIYLLLKEFLTNRKVGVVVLSDAFIDEDPGLVSGLMFNSKELVEDWSNYSIQSKLSVFKMAILGSLINMRNSILPMELEPKALGLEIEDYINSSGGSFPKYQRMQSDGSPGFIFQPINQNRKRRFETALVNSSDEAVPAIYIESQINQLLIRRMIQLCVEKGTKFYFQQVVNLENPEAQTRVLFPKGEFEEWNQYISGTISLPWRWVFEGLTEKEVGWYFGDPVHLNHNGVPIYSRAIAPALVKIFQPEGR